jgi:hypothetical protein
VNATGAGTDPHRLAARAAAVRPRWPSDAIAVSELLADFVHGTVMPPVVPSFSLVDGFARPADDHLPPALAASLRAEALRYRHMWRDDGTEESNALVGSWFALDTHR